MKTKIGAVVATLAAAASAAGAAVWARRKRDHKRLERKRRKASKARASGTSPSGAAAGATPATAAAAAGSGSVENPPKAAPAGSPEAGASDELTSIKGLGARSSERLAAVGVTTLAQVAAWSDADIDEIAPRIHVGAERIRREDWVGQAQAATKA
jgi:predicted flap endonuclease-1-like 5' DNA nuclease